jgi:HSP20 family protein
MALTRFNSILSDIDSLDNLLFDYSLPFRRNTIMNNYSHMRMDLKENEHEYVINVDIPGVNKSDIDISLDGNNLVISAERNYEKEDNNNRFHKFERSYGKLSRSILLPSNADKDLINASYINGVLNMTLPKIKTNISNRTKINIQ